MDLNAILLPLFALWAIYSFVNLFDRRVELVWRLAVLMICIFYGTWFYDEIRASATNYNDHFRDSIRGFLSAIPAFVGFGLLIFWPAVIMTSFYAAHPTLSRAMLRTFVLLTLFFWLFKLGSNYVTLPGLDKVTNWLPDKLELSGFSLPDFHVPTFLPNKNN